jgi:hypothetical protein
VAKVSLGGALVTGRPEFWGNLDKTFINELP